MTDVTREQLHAYLDDALDDAETARIEKLIRTSAAVRTRLTKGARGARPGRAYARGRLARASGSAA